MKQDGRRNEDTQKETWAEEAGCDSLTAKFLLEVPVVLAQRAALGVLDDIIGRLFHDI